MMSELVVNGNVYGQIISDAANHNDWAVSTAFTIVSLQVDDRVWIRSGTVHSGHVNGGGYEHRPLLVFYFEHFMLIKYYYH